MGVFGVAKLFDLLGCDIILCHFISNKTSPFLTCLDFGVCKAIRLVRFGYNTFTGCVV